MSLPSIYIPRMSIVHDEESIKTIMGDCQIGTVSYVDFTPVNKKPGFTENITPYFKSAFIHFSAVNNAHVKFWETILRGEKYMLDISLLHVGLDEYWICLKNKNPIQRSMMNIHQVVENGRYLENLVQKQENRIVELENRLDNLHRIMYQHLGGLFNQREQQGGACMERIKNLESELKILQQDLSTYGILY